MLHKFMIINYILCILGWDVPKKMLDDFKGVMKICKSKNDRQHKDRQWCIKHYTEN